MSEMPVSILSDGVGKPFSVRPAADDDLKYKSIFYQCLYYGTYCAQHVCYAVLLKA